MQHNSATRKFYLKSTQVQHNATQQCNRKILEKYLGGTSATQCNATVIHVNFTRNKPKCNATQYNTTVQKEDIRE